MKLYHGSTMTVRKPIISRGRQKNDFGKGFYTTTNREQAEKWAKIKKNREGKNARAIVSVYEIEDHIIDDSAYQTLHFEGATAEWLNFVVNNRRGKNLHNFDLVMGPVANDTLYTTINLYENGALDTEVAILQLRTHTLFDQLSFHTPQVCELLQFVESFEI